MNDKTDGDSRKPRSRPAGPAGDKRAGRSFKPRPLTGGKPRTAEEAPARVPRAASKSGPDERVFDERGKRSDRPAAAIRGRAPDRGASAKPSTVDRDRPSAAVESRPLRSARKSEVPPSEPIGSMRIAKRLARAGIASRRDAEGMIADGRVKLNGKLLDSPAVTVTGSDRIEVDNQALPAIERTRLWLFHKPAGRVTTNRDPEGRPTVFDRLPDDLPRVLSVGRLDINTEGLLLLTNDGGLARILELPATGWLRRYRVRAHGTIKQEQLDALRQGIAVDGVFYGAIEATLDSEKGANVWLSLGLREGKNREVKRILNHLGLDVNRLIRVSFGPFQLGDLPEGAVREIKGRMLRDQLGERLIEESGADFDAPIVNAFTNQVVEAARTTEASPRKTGDEWVSASETRPNRKKFGAAKREDALGRLDTKPGRRVPDAPRGMAQAEKRPTRPDRGERPERLARADRSSREDRGAPGRREDAAEASEAAAKRPGAPRRTANVWMAPGARPLGEKKASERTTRAPRVDRPKPVFGKARSPGDEARPRPASAPARVRDRVKSAPTDRAGVPPHEPRGTAGRGGDAPRSRGGDRPKDGPRRGPRA